MEIDACIPDNDSVRLIRQFVGEMDLTALYETYERMPSEKYASPEIMLKVILYAYHEGKEISSRTIFAAKNDGKCISALTAIFFYLREHSVLSF